MALRYQLREVDAALLQSGGRTRRMRMKPAEIVSAEHVNNFSLGAPPPFDVHAAELLANVLTTLPAKLQCRALRYGEEATSKDAVILATHSFWYAFITLQMPDLATERDQLLQLMALQYARLTLSLTCSRDAFFDHFPLLAAHAVLAGLRRHGALGVAKGAAEGPVAAGVFRHMVALLGGRVPPPDMLRAHMLFAEKPPDEDTAVGRREHRFHVPWKYEPTPAQQPPLAPPVILSLPPVERAKLVMSDAPAIAPAPAALAGAPSHAPLKRSATSWSPLSKVVRAQKGLEGAQRARIQGIGASSSSGDLLGRGTAYRPPKVAVDLRRQSPLVAIYTGAQPLAVLEAASLPPLQPVNRTGLGTVVQQPPSVAPPGAKRGPFVRQSVPGFGGRTRLGGASSFQAMQPAGTVERANQRIAELEREKKSDENNQKVVNAFMAAKCAEIERERDAKIAMPAPQLADYSYELARRGDEPRFDLM